MSTRKVQDGHVLTFTAPAALASGVGVKIGDAFGVTVAAAASGAPVVLALVGVHALPKAATITPAQGVKLYWDAAAGNVTTTSAGNTLIGVHASPVAAGAADATIPVRLGIVA